MREARYVSLIPRTTLHSDSEHAPYNHSTVQVLYCNTISQRVRNFKSHISYYYLISHSSHVVYRSSYLAARNSQLVLRSSQLVTCRSQLEARSSWFMAQKTKSIEMNVQSPFFAGSCQFDCQIRCSCCSNTRTALYSAEAYSDLEIGWQETGPASTLL